MSLPRVNVKSMKVVDMLAIPDGLRGHTPDAEWLLAKQVKEFGLLRLPVVNKATGRVIDGVLLVRALRILDITECPVLEVDVPEDMEAVAHLALNNHFGDWQWEQVSEQLKAIAAKGKANELTGFHEYDIGPLVAADWSPAAKGELEARAAQQNQGSLF